jgi:hypothetical protein
MTTPDSWKDSRIAIEHDECQQDEALIRLVALPHRWVEWDGTVEAWIGGARVQSTAESEATTWLLAAEGFDPTTGQSLKLRRRGRVIDIWTVREVQESLGSPVRYRDTRHLSNISVNGVGRAISHRVYARTEVTLMEPAVDVWRPWVAAFRGFVS